MPSWTVSWVPLNMHPCTNVSNRYTTVYYYVYRRKFRGVFNFTFFVVGWWHKNYNPWKVELLPPKISSKSWNLPPSKFSKRILDYVHVHIFIRWWIKFPHPSSCHRSSVIIVTLHQEVVCTCTPHTELVRWFQPTPLNQPLTMNPRHLHAPLNNAPSTRCVVWKYFYRMFNQLNTCIQFYSCICSDIIYYNHKNCQLLHVIVSLCVHWAITIVLNHAYQETFAEVYCL